MLLGLSLWIVPPPPIRNLLKHLMDNPPHPSLTDPPLPKFEPHITLATVPSTTPIAILRDSIPNNTKRLKISFTSAEAHDVYFRSSIVRCERTSELSHLLAAVKDSIERSTSESEDAVTVKAPDFPHLSLFYIDDDRAALRAPALQKLFDGGKLVKFDDGLGIDVGDESPELLRSFDADEIVIALCDGPVEGWVVLDRIKLARQVL